MHYYYQVDGGISNNRYSVGNTGKYFASPFKDIREQTILVENSESKNDSYRQKTKYDDAVDQYFSSYDLSALIGNRDSYLAGRLDSASDVDYYIFSYGQKTFYSRMGISTEITISLEDIPEGCDYELTIYDTYGNQVGIAKDVGNGRKEVTIPNWDGVTDKYIIRVESRDGSPVDSEASYKIKISENKDSEKSNQSVEHAEEIFSADRGDRTHIKNKYEENYLSELERLHQEQYNSLPEDQRYTGTKTVEELLDEMASGRTLSEQEKNYLKIFANLADYEKAEASGKIANELYPEIRDCLESAGIDIEGKEWGIELDASGNVVITGDLDEETKSKISQALSDEVIDKMWDYYIQASDIPTNLYNYLSYYRDINQFLLKATDGEYSWNDIVVEKNGKISGLPPKMCELLNSQEANARYEQLRDEILRFQGYVDRWGMQNILNFRAGYQFSDAGVSRNDVGDVVSPEENGAQYYDKLRSII